jgi:hypothetical protein
MNSRLQSDFRITSSNWVAVGAFLVLLSSAPSALSQKVSVPRTPVQEQASLEINSAAASYRAEWRCCPKGLFLAQCQDALEKTTKFSELRQKRPDPLEDQRLD